jgi:hypothetical protein
MQDVRELAVFFPPGAAAQALPLVRILQTVPAHAASAWARPWAAIPLVPVRHLPVVAHFAAEEVLTLAPPVAFDRE